MFNTAEKKERSLGTKLFLKATRCASPKCASVRNPALPGAHGAKRRRAKSEVGEQIQEKQKFKATYGLREAAMRRVFKTAAKSAGVTGLTIAVLLERRLDNALYRLGLAASRSVARQLVNHGHILVNGRRVNISSYLVKLNDKISIRPQSKPNLNFKDLAENIKKYEPPVWLAIDKEKLEGTVKSLPKDFEVPFNIDKVVDFYAKMVK